MGAAIGKIAGTAASIGGKAASFAAKAAKPILTGVSSMKGMIKPILGGVGKVLEPAANAAFLASNIKGMIDSNNYNNTPAEPAAEPAEDTGGTEDYGDSGGVEDTGDPGGTEDPGDAGGAEDTGDYEPSPQPRVRGPSKSRQSPYGNSSRGGMHHAAMYHGLRPHAVRHHRRWGY
jgi:hypothetical protein